MLKIVEKKVMLEFPRDHHLHCLLCQIPNQIRIKNEADPDAISKSKWERVHSVLKLVAQGSGNLGKLHFLVFPETVLPAEYFTTTLEYIERNFRNNTVTMVGLEHMRLTDFCALVGRFRADNAELLESIRTDRLSGDIDCLNVNSAATIIKDANGETHVYLQAKSHPFALEEKMDANHDLYHGKVFPLWRSEPNAFNFMALICFDYIYRTLLRSNITQVIDHANEMYFSSRQQLDLLLVLECNPKPEHNTFRDVIHGFYGELLEASPGVRETITVFCNTTKLIDPPADVREDDTFGYSSVVISYHKQVHHTELAEFSTDDFGGLPISRLRFGPENRLYYFNLPVFYEFDPRSTRMPLKVHRVYKNTESGGWENISTSDNSSHLGEHC
ncbi:MAG: hypothetical protein RBR06_08440 [Desulfuromonadaceae bacterium]|nr:hypothetical protein [Desulfuromonadaceae bacterium]